MKKKCTQEYSYFYHCPWLHSWAPVFVTNAALVCTLEHLYLRPTPFSHAHLSTRIGDQHRSRLHSWASVFATDAVLDCTNEHQFLRPTPYSTARANFSICDNHRLRLHTWASIFVTNIVFVCIGVQQYVRLTPCSTARVNISFCDQRRSRLHICILLSIYILDHHRSCLHIGISVCNQHRSLLYECAAIFTTKAPPATITVLVSSLEDPFSSARIRNRFICAQRCSCLHKSIFFSCSSEQRFILYYLLCLRKKSVMSVLAWSYFKITKCCDSVSDRWTEVRNKDSDRLQLRWVILYFLHVQ